jgi:peptidylprolyl isomerase
VGDFHEKAPSIDREVGMHKTLILAVVGVLLAPLLFGQTKPTKQKRMVTSHPGAVVGVKQPTKVTGAAQTTPSGVRYWDIRVGEGDAATRGHVVKVLYSAWVEHGKEFASSVSDGNPPIFTLGAGQVIPGWEEGVEGMRVGGKRQLRVPPSLAYGASGLPPLVPSNATLVFDVELVAMQ